MIIQMRVKSGINDVDFAVVVVAPNKTAWTLAVFRYELHAEAYAASGMAKAEADRLIWQYGKV